jgi:hypothetical protein
MQKMGSIFVAVILSAGFSARATARVEPANMPIAIESTTEIAVTNSITPISLFGDSTQDLILNVSNSMIGTVQSGFLMILVNGDRLNDGAVPKRKNGDVFWKGSFALVNTADAKGNRIGSGGNGFEWSNHVGEFNIKSVFLYQKSVNQQFFATYLVHTVLEQGPKTTSIEDIGDARLMIHVYRLFNEKGHGTGYGRDITLREVAVVQASKATGDSHDLANECANLVATH